MGVDWSEGRWRKMLVDQRKFMWREDTIAMLARWMGIEPGATVVDSGCGLGFLGAAYRPWFGEEGRYVGVDINERLLRDAAGTAREWADGAGARFVQGDALRLPLPADCADFVMCQTLLSVVEDPAKALGELVRVCRPGGLVACHEADNPASSLRGALRNPIGLSDEDRLHVMRMNLYIYRGHENLGRGDQGVGGRLNRLLFEAGLVSIDIRMSDRVFHLEPPYEGDLQQWLLAAVRKSAACDPRDEEALAPFREQVLAGGGTEAEIERYVEIVERRSAADRAALDRDEYFTMGSGPLYIAIGRKP